ncbi:MAG: helix-turn-helix transcriptional regulator [Alphaproteobacteria bacterium]|nr:helix-turn-helix transcriptional regulator [Alphaproteobacteria bacterium]
MTGKIQLTTDLYYKQQVSKNLKKLAKEAKITQKYLATSTGISASTLNGYFKGENLPSPYNVEKLANFFKVKKSEIDARFNIPPFEMNAQFIDNFKIDIPDDPEKEERKEAKKRTEIRKEIKSLSLNELEDLIDYIKYMKFKRENWQ